MVKNIIKFFFSIPAIGMRRGGAKKRALMHVTEIFPVHGCSFGLMFRLLTGPSIIEYITFTAERVTEY